MFVVQDAQGMQISIERKKCERLNKRTMKDDTARKEELELLRKWLKGKEGTLLSVDKIRAYINNRMKEIRDVGFSIK